MHYSYGYFEEDHLGQVADIGLWQRILRYTRPHWQKISAAVFLSFLVIGADLALPYMVRLGIDHYIVNTAVPMNIRIGGLARLTSLFVGVILAGFAVNFLQVIILEYTGQVVMHQVRQQLFGHMLDLDMDFFHRHPSGKLTTRLTNDIQNMNEMFTSVIVTLFNDFIQLAGIMTILFLMNWKLALILTILLPFVGGYMALFSRLARDAFRAIRTQLARINSFLQESLSGMMVIQIFAREKDAYQRFVGLSNEYLRKNIHQIKIFAVFMPVMELLRAAAIGCIIWYGGGDVLRQHMTLGELVAFLSYIRLFFQPLRELSQKYSIVQSAMASAERIFQLLDTPAPLLPAAAIKDFDMASADVEFRGISFSYDGKLRVLQDISFHVQPGRTLAIVGATGSGKTTLVNLLERFYEPDAGKIFIGGRELDAIDINWLRHQVGLVMQDVFIIPGSLRRNVLLDQQLNEEGIQQVISESQLCEVVAQLPDGLETKIGEGGMGLSAGQMQLLAFARVLARDPSILILDEATSSVDTETEMLIDRAISSTLANRTSIVIAHRLSTIRRADDIIVMDQGRIVEHGSHEELMAKSGLYHRLQDLQIRSDEPENHTEYHISAAVKPIIFGDEPG
jgi:ATP-binding cassette subfamily B multidrug efflux pump